MNNPNIAITVQPDMSIDDLVQRQQNGSSVQRSAHVGNLSPYNMALAEAGIPLLLVDHNMTKVDTNYTPELVRRRDDAREVAPANKLVCAVDTFEGVSLQALHMRSMQDAIPKGSFFTNTEQVQANREVFEAVVDATIAVVPEAFARVALPDGSVAKPKFGGCTRALAMAQRGDILQFGAVGESGESAILPNVVDIVGGFVVQQLSSAQDGTVTHLSGPDMVRYIQHEQTSLPMQAVYAELRWLGGAVAEGLPEVMSVELVPASPAKFATSMQRADSLVGLLDVVREHTEQIAECAAKRKVFFTTPVSKDRQSKEAFVGAMRSVENSANARVLEALSAIPEVLAEPGDGHQLSQFDVANEGGLFVPDVNRQMTMAQLEALAKQLAAIQKKAMP